MCKLSTALQSATAVGSTAKQSWPHCTVGLTKGQPAILHMSRWDNMEYGHKDYTYDGNSCLRMNALSVAAVCGPSP